ncbi:MAG: YceI family protein [Rhodothermales bacterium]
MIRTAFVLLGILLLWPSYAWSQTTWRIAQGPSTVGFKVQHFYFTHVDGVFRSFNGTVVRSGDDFEGAQINASISVASVYTGIPARDEELMQPFFFDAEQHPDLLFESTSFEHVGDSTYVITGMLTIRGVTKPIELHAVRHDERIIRDGKRRVDFLATGRLDRFDFGLEWNKVAEFGNAIVGKMIDITLDVVLIEE